jgi:2-polyprenyl-3-methyl-5-hydroxy-6-metoxy-1,4-benzoquinol methylase
MLEINTNQKKYYEFDLEEKFEHGGSFATKIWNNIREYQYKMTDDIDFYNKLFNLHKVWIGDLQNKKVLDLGCHKGNELSEYLATNSKEYYACDLSESALVVMEQNFKSKNINNANFLAKDILSNNFPEKDFDVIYAKAVFHHFKYFEDFLIRIKSLLKPDGFIVTSDPIDTYLPLGIIRKLYRPFQYDKDWEFPFTKESLRLIEKHFAIEELAGMMGKTKYAFPLYLLSKKYAIEKSKQWVEYDLHKIKMNHKSLYNCLRVSFKLKNK